MPDTNELLVGRHILIVEDEYFIAEIMEDWLRRAGAEVVGPVPSVQQALVAIKAEAGRLDAAVLDVNLGRGETAYAVADHLNQLGVPYLFATGDVRIIDHSAYCERPRLDKPISQHGLLRAVGKLLKAGTYPQAK
ncbi:response regulator [Roseomonas sp. WA12]